MRLRSIRWRLPLSYAAIALLTAGALGAVLLTSLQSYFQQREYDRLRGAGWNISRVVDDMLRNNAPAPAVQAQIENMAFIAQTRLRLLDKDRQLIADSGAPGQQRVDLLYAIPGSAQLFSGGVQVDLPQYAPIITLRNAGDADSSGPEATHTWNTPVAGSSGFFVASSPFGPGLSSEADTNGRRSDQHIEAALTDANGQPIGYLELSDGPALGGAMLDSVTQGWIAASAVAILVAAAAGYIMSLRMTSPLLALTRVTARMADGELSARADVTRRDEIGTLARSFNEMAGRVENTVVSLRRFVADAAHELHTPLTALNTNLELAMTEPDDAARCAFLERAQGQIKRLEGLTISLLDLSRLESGTADKQRAPVNLTAVAEEMGEMYASRAEQQGIGFEFDLPTEPVIVNGSEGQLRRAIGNLLDNAIKFTPENGTVKVGLRHEAQTVELWVKDTGIGIPPEDLPLLFSRFHRGRNAAPYPGSGLGLAITRIIVESHQGHVTVASGSEGTRFTLQFQA